MNTCVFFSNLLPNVEGAQDRKFIIHSVFHSKNFSILKSIAHQLATSLFGEYTDFAKAEFQIEKMDVEPNHVDSLLESSGSNLDLSGLKPGSCVLKSTTSGISVNIVKEKVHPSGWFSAGKKELYLFSLGEVSYSICEIADPPIDDVINDVLEKQQAEFNEIPSAPRASRCSTPVPTEDYEQQSASDYEPLMQNAVIEISEEKAHSHPITIPVEPILSEETTVCFTNNPVYDSCGMCESLEERCRRLLLSVSRITEIEARQDELLRQVRDLQAANAALVGAAPRPEPKKTALPSPADPRVVAYSNSIKLIGQFDKSRLNSGFLDALIKPQSDE